MKAGRFDAVIAGGGLSGLSLAAHLAARGWSDRSVLVIDEGGPAPPATCWAFWSARPGLLDSAVSRTFRQVAVHAGGTSSVLPLGPYRYRVVRRPDLSRAVTGVVAGCPGFAVRPGRVERVGDGIDLAEVTVDGERLRSSWVFDSVSPPPRDTPADARLAFTGWKVHCDRPTFDPHTPILFDFRTPQAGGARFVYVLPDAPHRALVELTEFVPRHGRPADTADRCEALAAYLRDVLGSRAYTIARTESAVLPLRAYPPSRAGRRVLRIGARAGLVKATTGYAYQRIQRDSVAIARSLVRHGHPFDVPSSRRRHRLLDAVLLDVLDHEPAQLERAFIRLFSTNPAERVLGFLDEDSNLRDELRLIISLPPAPYLRATGRRLFLPPPMRPVEP
jgi:lycopene beta-cyclase